MTRCVFFLFKIWRVVFFSIQSLSCKRNFNSKSCFLKKHEKCKICRFHGAKRTKTWFLWMQTFFKIWHFEKFSMQNLTRCKIFKSKSDALWKFYFKIWQDSKLFLRNLIFILLLRFWLNDDIFCERYYQFIYRGELKYNAC